MLFLMLLIMVMLMYVDVVVAEIACDASVAAAADNAIVDVHVVSAFGYIACYFHAVNT